MDRENSFAEIIGTGAGNLGVVSDSLESFLRVYGKYLPEFAIEDLEGIKSYASKGKSDLLDNFKKANRANR